MPEDPGEVEQARFLDRIRAAYGADPGLGNLLFAGYFRDAVGQAQGGWRRVVATAAEVGIAIPAFASSLAYYDGFRRERGPASLLQAQRDFFGLWTVSSSGLTPARRMRERLWDHLVRVAPMSH